MRTHGPLLERDSGPCTGQRDQTAKYWRSSIFIAAALLLGDFATKWLALQYAGDADRWLITPRRNPELALGVLDLGMHPAVIAVLVLVSISIVAHAFLLAFRELAPPWTGLMMLSGILGNALDRAATGAVHDWLYLGRVVANVADLVLVAGLAGYATYAWRAADSD